MAMGEEVGTAAALSCKNNKKPFDINIFELKQQLQKQSAIVPGMSEGTAFLKESDGM